MSRQTQLFLNELTITPNTHLTSKIDTFLKSVGRILYRDGQLYFIKGQQIVESLFVETKSTKIVEYDGSSMTHISRVYYLGEDLEKDRQLADLNPTTTNTTDTSTNNNNNNNNNNG